MMSILKIPDGLLDEVHAMLARFWWGSNGTTWRMHWHSWDHLCKPKAMGGMGFRDMKVFNQALLAKQLWRLYSNPNPLLLSVLKARHFKHDSILEAYRGYDPSYSWRSLRGAKSLLLDGLKWRVGNGSMVRVWQDSWLPGTPTSAAPSHGPIYDPTLMVADLINFERKRVRWIWARQGLETFSQGFLSVQVSLTCAVAMARKNGSKTQGKTKGNGNGKARGLSSDSQALKTRSKDEVLGVEAIDFELENEVFTPIKLRVLES
ncbi:uncharacterized mitochondrial protein AtMg00310-like [Spinacia oleracea]|uniref:Uncharacterized mitochondrial protein AtMg00310-like n=1 Tax=Spinacia oleracea TaxID=3562 RepID=A0ABM3R7C8_SPIOL|nr:uncharacterized mitochondrial protein AtMg00310-like [Spinacia oleracea]XP_056691518.1 uncharacterized mitochondrial protein AtMg00310-like [Spinacia oleracea]XP_056691519.1 uncharacterized mitochondrial protein AtMg00310-like [Spinacia oleracea]